MRIRWVRLACVLLAVGVLGIGCTEQQRTAKTRVIASIPPLAGLAERIAGEHIEVSVLVGSGQSPHTFEPTPTQVVELGEAGLFLSVGMPFEEELAARIEDSASGPRTVDVGEKIERRVMQACAHEDHAGHHHHDHAEELLPDPHLWMSPLNLAVMAQETANAIMELDPQRADAYRANLASLLEDINRVHETVTARMAPFKGQLLYVFHPAFGYFTEAYGLEQRAVEIEGKQPSPKQLAELIDQAKADGARLLIVQPQFDQRNAQAVASAIGGVVVPIDPLARDILGELRRLATTIEAGLLPDAETPSAPGVGEG